MKAQEVETLRHCIRLFDEEETEVNCMHMKDLLQHVNTKGLAFTLIQPSKANSGSKAQIEGDLLVASHALQNKLPPLPRSKVVYLVPAAFAIMHGKGKFFDIFVNSCPQVLCLTNALNVELDSPLRCAIDSGLPALVSKVLNNEHFIAHEFNSPVPHLKHILKCQDQTAQTRSPEISRMLNDAIVIRMPIIIAMKENDLASMRSMLTNAAFNPTEHRALIKDCISYARKHCNKPIVDLLVATINI